jgi:hypothetical protein
LERNVFRMYRDVESPTAGTSLGRMHIIAASGMQAEVVEIARRVKRLLVSGVAAEDVVVAFRSTHEVADRVWQAFDDFGIPMHLDHPRRLATTPLVRTLGSVLRLAAEDWPYKELLSLAANRTLRILDPMSENARDARRAIEACVRYAQLPSGRRALMSQLSLWAGDPGRARRPSADDSALAAATLEKLGKKLDALPQRANIAGWLEALGSLVHELGIVCSTSEAAAGHWEILIDGLTAAARIDARTGWGAEEPSLAEFARLLAATAAHAPAETSADAVGRVRVLSAEAARYTRPRHLFVCGLSEQSFPRTRGEEPHDAHAFDAAAARSGEMLLFYQLVTRPTETLSLSYPSLDERAQALPASPFLLEFERAFGSLSVPRTIQPLNYGRDATSADAPPLARSELRRAAVARALERRRELLANLAAADERVGSGGQAIVAGIEAVAARGRRESFGGFEGIVDSAAAAARLRAAFGPGRLWSPSRLERYAECPFLFFGEQLLLLEPTPELALASDVRRRGSVLHETLARLYAELRGAEVNAVDAAEVVARKFHEALAEVTQSRPGRGVDAAIREIERRQIAA